MGKDNQQGDLSTTLAALSARVIADKNLKLMPEKSDEYEKNKTFLEGLKPGVKYGNSNSTTDNLLSTVENIKDPKEKQAAVVHLIAGAVMADFMCGRDDTQGNKYVKGLCKGLYQLCGANYGTYVDALGSLEIGKSAENLGIGSEETKVIMKTCELARREFYKLKAKDIVVESNNVGKNLKEELEAEFKNWKVEEGNKLSFAEVLYNIEIKGNDKQKATVQEFANNHMLGTKLNEIRQSRTEEVKENPVVKWVKSILTKSGVGVTKGGSARPVQNANKGQGEGPEL